MADLLYRGLKLALTPVADVYFRLRGSGADALPAGPFILAANHTSLLDWMFVARFVPRPVRFVLSRGFFDRRGVTWAYRALGVIPIRERGIEASAVRQLLETLGRGEIVGMFPEGRITRDGRLLPMQPGIIALAARAGVPIVPAAIRGGYEAFPRHARVPKPYPVRVRFGAPFSVPPSADDAAQRALAADLTARIRALRDQA